MNLNLDRVRAAMSKNKVALGALGALAVAALAWRARTESSGTTKTGTGAAGTSTTPYSYSASGYTGGTAYDSSSSDVYNALQPQLEAVGNAVDQLRDLFQTVPVPGTPTTPTPAPAPTYSSNRDWLNAAIGGWTQQGEKYNARDIQAALSGYLGGTTTSTAQQYGINWAVSKYGAPPEGTAGVGPVVPA